ncbi:tetratricopeptide repeat protein [Rhodopirellula sp. MGV]|uniref:tetratricopeptide repeat protein n=1 Tax=Rhodopirellula sp. MGV TaxID=2023130 RepID=UPI000B97A0AC|nr:tetratricopeptide repeat protein [Rhodopirellula sp. MGV]OYP32324.1 hypothetical protein CGZ80_19855 [Rhodopirellula sp. MGV]PNY35892.1 tetratricopeptide repeat-containing protein [Rhodopirellula baltica]
MINAIIGLLGVVGIVYASSFDGTYVLDDDLILEQRYVHPYSSWGHFLRDSRQLVDLSFWANYHFNGFDPWGYHLVNLLVHLASVLCVFSIGLWATELWATHEFAKPVESNLEDKGNHQTSIWPAWWIAVLWGVHPLTTESVTYIIQRYESVAVLFMLLTLRCWCGLLDGKRSAAIGVIFFAWCAILSKQISISLPFLIFVWDLFFSRLRGGAAIGNFSKHRLKALRTIAWGGILSAWSYLVLCLSGYLFAMVPTVGSEYAARSIHHELSPLQYLQTQSVVILHYMKLVLYPRDLRLDYGWMPEHDPLRYIPAMCLLASLALLGIWLFYHRKCAGILIVMVYLTLAPRSSFAPSPDMVFEHRMYFPLVFLVALLVVGGVALRRTMVSMRQVIRLIGVGLLLMWGMRTHQRNLDYQSTVRFWQSNFDLEPNNPRVAHNLGMAYASLGDWKTARVYAETAVSQNDKYAGYYIGLGDTQRETGDPVAAIKSFSRAIELEPESGEASRLRLGTSRKD